VFGAIGALEGSLPAEGVGDGRGDHARLGNFPLLNARALSQLDHFSQDRFVTSINLAEERKHMHLKTRSLLAATAALAAGTAIAVGSGSFAVATANAHRSTTTTQAPSARFLAESRAALVSYLSTSKPQALHAGPATTTAQSSFNWSGYADVSTTDGTFTKVSASWTTPSVKCTAEDMIVSNWVGLDGWNDSTVEQDGTIGWCYKSVPTYFTWYEMYPAGTVEVGTSLKVGDKISASVTRVGTSYTLALTDATTPANSFSESATCAASTCLDTSAEWITERPAFSIGIVPQADYKTFKMTNGAETAAGKSGTISSYATTDQITMIDATQAYDLTTTSALTGGAAFTTTWKNSY
jgi:hypothetical protein